MLLLHSVRLLSLLRYTNEGHKLNRMSVLKTNTTSEMLSKMD